MYTQLLFDYAAFSSAQRQGKVHLCTVCPESSGALKGVLGENLYVASEKDVCIHCCLRWPCTIHTEKLWYEYNYVVIFHLACKEVYHIMIFISTASENKIGEVHHSLLPRLSSHPELAVWDWFRMQVWQRILLHKNTALTCVNLMKSLHLCNPCMWQISSGRIEIVHALQFQIEPSLCIHI